MSETKQVMAIDFGTTNTYITLCLSNSKNKTVVKLDGQKNPEICTTILYSDVPEANLGLFPMIGEMATQTFGKSPQETIQKKKYRYASHFKPQIAEGDGPRQNAVDFFRTILRDAGKAGVSLCPLSCQVIIGVPCEANQKFQQTLKEIAEEAGFGRVELVEEAKGALFNDVGIGQFPLEDLLAGYLTIDFGGGTCDYAFMRDGKVEPKYCWGDMRLGGALFDDLFFQWFCDQHPGKEQELIESGKDFLVRTYFCREAKEDFSRYIGKGPEESWEGMLGQFGEMTGLTKSEFLTRAKQYRPSRSFKEHQQKLGIKFSKELQDGPVNLLQWFNDSLTRGMERCGLQPSDVRVVSLAGGSSLWFFVKERCRELFPHAKMSTNPNPFAAISEGLSILPALQTEFKEKQEKATIGKAEFIEKEILPNVWKQFERGREKIIRDILTELFDGRIKPILLNYRNTGGTIASLKTRIEQAVKSYEQTLRESVAKTFQEEFGGLFGIALEKTDKWLKGLGLHLHNTMTTLPMTTEPIKVSKQNVYSLGASITNAIALLIGGMTTTFVASLCGGTGMALLMAGPIGLVIGAILAAIVLLPTYLALGNKSQDYVEQYFPIPSVVTYRTLTDKRIAQSREQMEKDLTKNLTAEAKAPIEKLVGTIDHLIEQEIARLGVINLF